MGKSFPEFCEEQGYDECEMHDKLMHIANEIMDQIYSYGNLAPHIADRINLNEIYEAYPEH